MLVAIVVAGCTDGDDASGNSFSMLFDPAEPDIAGLDCTPLAVDLLEPAATCRFDIPAGTPGELPAGDYTLTEYAADCSSIYTQDVHGVMRIEHLPSGDVLVKERRPSSISGYPDQYVNYIYVIDTAGKLRQTTCDPFWLVHAVEHVDTTANRVTLRFDDYNLTTLVYTRR